MTDDEETQGEHEQTDIDNEGDENGLDVSDGWSVLPAKQTIDFGLVIGCRLYCDALLFAAPRINYYYCVLFVTDWVTVADNRDGTAT